MEIVLQALGRQLGIFLCLLSILSIVGNLFELLVIGIVF